MDKQTIDEIMFLISKLIKLAVEKIVVKKLTDTEHAISFEAGKSKDEIGQYVAILKEAGLKVSSAPQWSDLDEITGYYILMEGALDKIQINDKALTSIVLNRMLIDGKSDNFVVNSISENNVMPFPPRPY
jgi:hypothetical protein